MTGTLTIIFDYSVYDDLAKGSSSVVYIFHKGIISLWLCAYEVYEV